MESQVVFVPVGNVPASGFYFNDSFTGAGVVNPSWVSSAAAGSAPAVLTARGDATKPAGGIAGIGSGADAVGSGALRLTGATNNQAAFVLYDQAFDSSKGVNITFDLFAYGGQPFTSGEQPGDGLSFFLIDGSTPGDSVVPGGFGGSLGYATKSTEQDGVVDVRGITKGFLGIGFDEFGNFANPNDLGTTASGPGRRPDSITVRGSGDGSTGYSYRGGTATLSEGIDVPGVTSRTAAKRTVEIDVDSNGNVDISIDLNADGDFDDANERNLDIATTDGTRPSTFKFGFAASTGGSTNIHEVRNLAISPSKSSNIGNSPTPTTVSFGDFGTGLTYVENAAAGAVTTGLVIEGAPTNIGSATVRIANNFSATQDRLTIGNSTVNSGTVSGLNWTYDPAAGTLTFTGAGDAATYQAALRQVTYANSSEAPTTGDRTIRYTLSSGSGANTTAITSRDALVKINSVNDLPTAINLSSTGVPTGQAGAVVGNITVVDLDSPIDGNSYSFTVTGGGDKFEVVGNATSGFQLKLKAGQTIAANEVIPALTVNGNDPGAGAFTQNFNLTPGQRNAEIFWRNPNGQEVFWQVRNSSELVAGVDVSSSSFDPSWRLVKVTDMDLDGVQDHVYQKGNEIRYLLLNQTAGQTSGVKGTVAPTFGSQLSGLAGQAATFNSDFRLVGVENVSGSSQADLIFFNTKAGQLVYWTAEGNQIVGAGFFTSPSAPNGVVVGANVWSVEALADFTGDGKTDILWRNTSGLTVMWRLDGTVIDLSNKSGVVGTISPGSELRGVGDFNGDGIQDVVWRNLTTNVTTFWTFGSDVSGVPSVKTITDNSRFVGRPFQVEAVADINGDGKSDLVWRDTVTNRVVVWNLDLGLNGAGANFELSSLKTGSGFILDFLGANPTRQPLSIASAWDIDAANGIAPVAAAV